MVVEGFFSRVNPPDLLVELEWGINYYEIIPKPELIKGILGGFPDPKPPFKSSPKNQ